MWGSLRPGQAVAVGSSSLRGAPPHRWARHQEVVAPILWLGSDRGCPDGGGRAAPWAGQGSHSTQSAENPGEEFQHFCTLEPASQWVAPKRERQSGMTAWRACTKRCAGTALVGAEGSRLTLCRRRSLPLPRLSHWPQQDCQPCPTAGPWTLMNTSSSLGAVLCAGVGMPNSPQGAVRVEAGTFQQPPNSGCSLDLFSRCCHTVS